MVMDSAKACDCKQWLIFASVSARQASRCSPFSSRWLSARFCAAAIRAAGAAAVADLHARRFRTCPTGHCRAQAGQLCRSGSCLGGSYRPPELVPKPSENFSRKIGASFASARRPSWRQTRSWNAGKRRATRFASVKMLSSNAKVA